MYFPAYTRRALLALALAGAPLLLAHGQSVGIGTTAPNPAAALDITATGKGLLIPRMDSATRAQIAAPPDGLMVFQTDFRRGFWYAAGGSWVFIPDQARNDARQNRRSWSTSGNSGTTPGTNFIGTTDNQDLVVKVNGVETTRFKANGAIWPSRNTTLADVNVMIGVNAGNGLPLFGTGANTYVGSHAAESGTGAHTTSIGYSAGRYNTSSNNTFVGSEAGRGTGTGPTSGLNVAIGTGAGRVIGAAGNNVYVGHAAAASATGGGNTALGWFAGTGIYTGSGNTILGQSAGSSLVNSFDGNNLTLLGNAAGTSAANLTNATAIGYNARVAQSNSVVLGGTGADAVRVGIGSTAPLATLDVARGAAGAGTAVFRGTDRHSHFSFGTSEDTYLRGGKLGSHLLLNDNGGNVGVGTSSPAATLHVGGTVKVDGANTLEFGAGVGGKEVNAGKIGYHTFTTDALDIVGAGTNSGDRKIKFWNEGGAAFRGAVGIGTDTPQDLLHLHHPSFGRARISAGSGQAGIGFLSDNSGETVLYSPTGTDDLRAYVGGADRMVITSDGYVGIGEPNPTRRLAVRASQATTAVLRVDNDDAGFSPIGIIGAATASNGGSGGIFSGGQYGLRCFSTGTSTLSYGLHASAGSGGTGPGYAGYFDGRVHVNGTLSKNGGTFRIDHPQDPENKYLVHSFVESPEMLNLYRGHVTTDAQCRAVVELPAYFEAENVGVEYQLTCLGQFAQAIVQEEVRSNRFVIATDRPNVTVSWAVSGARNDKWAQQHPIDPEEPKRPEQRGKYLNPELYGKPANQGLFLPPTTVGGRL